MVTNRGVKLGCGDGRSVPIETFLQSGLGFADILDPTNCASDEIDNIRSGAGDIALGVMRFACGSAVERVAFVDMCITNDASVGCAFECAMLNGRGMIGKRWDFGTDDEIFEVTGASECHDGSVRNGLQETIRSVENVVIRMQDGAERR